MANRGRFTPLAFGLLVAGGVVAIILITKSPVPSEAPVRFTPLVRNTVYEVTIRTSPDSPRTGKETTIFLTVTREGQPTDPATDGRLLHAVVTSPRLATIHHTFPIEEERAGVYRLKENFTEPGAHRVWIEIENPTQAPQHGEHPDLTAWADIEVRGGHTTPSSPSPTPYRIEMEPSTARIGVPTAFRLKAVDAAGVAGPLSEISAPALYAIVGPAGNASHSDAGGPGEERTYFQHGHTENEPAPSGTRETATITRKNTFSAPGRYMLWVVMFIELEDLQIIAVEHQFPIEVTP